MGFRKQFVFPSLTYVNWFPGHMAKGMREMTRKLQECDCVLEVHDARIPFSGRNPKFLAMLNRQPKILVLNKMDLANPLKSKEVKEALHRQGEREVIMTNSQMQFHQSIRQVMARILKLIGWKDSSDQESIRLMVVGMPNVGKSSLINALRRNYLRKGKATKVGKLPGVTRAVLTKILVSEHPRMYLVDTPGIMMPSIPNEEVAMKLFVTGMLEDHLVGEKLVLDYLLFVLNQHEKFQYVDYYQLPEPCDDVEIVLDHTAKRIGALLKGGHFDHMRAAQHFLYQFRAGKLGRITFDTCPDKLQSTAKNLSTATVL